MQLGCTPNRYPWVWKGSWRSLKMDRVHETSRVTKLNGTHLFFSFFRTVSFFNSTVRVLSQSCSHFGLNKRPVISPRLHPSRWLRREPREPSAPLPWPTWRWNFLKRRNWRSDSRSAKAVHPESLSNHTVILFYMGCLPPAIYIYISLYI